MPVTRDEKYMRMALRLARRSEGLTNPNPAVGAVVVKEKRVLTTGYNGAPKGLKHCAEVGCVRTQNNVESGTRHELCRGLHGEQNAFLQAALHGTSLKDSILYSTTQPCIICAKMIINAGIKEIVIRGDYPDKMAKEFLRKAKVIVRIIN